MVDSPPKMDDLVATPILGNLRMYMLVRNFMTITFSENRKVAHGYTTSITANLLANIGVYNRLHWGYFMGYTTGVITE